MSSDSEVSFGSESSASLHDLEESGEEVEVVTGKIEPYQDEPLASDRDEEEEGEDADHDGLTPSVLEARFDGRLPIIEW